jgi:hypothetical protein
MVMHRVLNQLLRSVLDSGILSRLDAAILIGDGDRVSRDRTRKFGKMHPNRHGVGLEVRSQSGSGITRFPLSLGRRVLEVCNRNDPVCDSDGLLIDLLWRRVHFGYGDSPELRRASREAARSVLSIPLPTPARWRSRRPWGPHSLTNSPRTSRTATLSSGLSCPRRPCRLGFPSAALGSSRAPCSASPVGRQRSACAA